MAAYCYVPKGCIVIDLDISVAVINNHKLHVCIYSLMLFLKELLDISGNVGVMADCVQNM